MSILPRIRALAARGRKRLNDKAYDWTNCILSQPLTPFLTWTFNVTNFTWGWDKYKILVQYKRKEGEEGFWRNPAILWLRRAARREKHETNYSGKDGKTAKSLMIMIMMTMIITLLIKEYVKYVFVTKFDLECTDRPLIYKFIKVHQHTLS